MTITFTLAIFLTIGAILMCIPIAIQMKWYRMALWKITVVSVSIVITGFLGSELLFFLENGSWGGKSFFGAIFLSPLTFLFVSKFIRIPYLESLDLCATAGCLILALLKVQCMIEGCCQGIILFMDSDYVYVRFPSQVVEFVVALLLVVVLLILSRNQKNRGRIYPITLVLYGGARFVLNFLRDDWDRAHNMNLPIPIGNIWSIIAITIGIVWLIIAKKRKNLSNVILSKN